MTDTDVKKKKKEENIPTSHRYWSNVQDDTHHCLTGQMLTQASSSKGEGSGSAEACTGSALCMKVQPETKVSSQVSVQGIPVG